MEKVLLGVQRDLMDKHWTSYKMIKIVQRVNQSCSPGGPDEMAMQPITSVAVIIFKMKHWRPSALKELRSLVWKTALKACICNWL